ncbi:MAG: rhodanese-like domain-containing protein [Pseudomonadota bacterium]|nr:rhodanese-like domain-containing protein [Pseudomonadota bacterium]
MEMKLTHKDLIDAALAEIETHSVEASLSLLQDENTVFVDLRDPRELQREGKIPNAFHAPRGMLEFWVDPSSPYFKDVFGSGQHFVFYCQSGWRSALATKAVQDMGLPNVSHIGDGYRGWKDSGAPTEEVPSKR